MNHRKLLDAVFAVSGVPDASFRPISSAVDKLDKVDSTECSESLLEVDEIYF